MTSFTKARRHGLALLVGYVAVFLVLHGRLPDSGPGLLGHSPGYLAMTSRLPTAEPIDAGTDLPSRFSVQAAFAVISIILALGYFWTLRAVRNGEVTIGIGSILGWTLLFCVPLILVPQMPSQDLYVYAMQSRIDLVYGDNPLVNLPILYPNDPILPYVFQAWRVVPSPYGPLWHLVSLGAGASAIAIGGKPWSYVFVYKLLACGLHLLNVTIIWRILGRCRPQQQVWGTMLYAWAPLPLIEFAGSAHNDSLMIAAALMGLWCAQLGRWRSAVAFLTAAALVKYSAVVILGLYLVKLVAERPRWGSRVAAAAQAALLILVIGGLSYVLDWNGNGTLVALRTEASSPAVNSPARLVIRLGEEILSRQGFDREAARTVIARVVLWGGGAVLILASLVATARVWRHPTFDMLTQTSCWLMVVVLVVGAPWFWPWYVTWPLALAPFVPWLRGGQLCAVFSCTVFFLYNRLPASEVLVFTPVVILAGFTLWQAFRLKSTTPEVLAG